ncbi:uncharacterized protein LOC108459098 [Gossypium arboreum]|uniref:uncharacterized protein LOC108459098 n=1 Tax=Gossypium arboreum TaxID=29729 RepID=UPI0008192231|nr:uncharacterized protein LOC108459098 [Gossypium arboreum]
MTQNELNLRQRRWLELLKDYDLTIECQPRKENVVVDALSKKTMATLLSLRAKLTLTNNGALLEKLVVKSTHVSQILEEQMKDIKCKWFKQNMLSGKIVHFYIGKEGELRFRNQVFVPRLEGILLVAKNEERDLKIHFHLPNMSKCKDRAPSTIEKTVSSGNSQMEMTQNHHGLCIWIALQSLQEELCMGGGR